MKPTTGLAILAAALTLTACSSGGDPATPSGSSTPSTSVAAASTTAPPTTSTPAPAPVALASVEAAVQPLGLTCSEQTNAALFCSRGDESWQFRVSPAGDGDRAFRSAACQSGMVGGSKQVITDGKSLVVYAGNDGQDVAGFARELAGVGLTGEPEAYCP